MSKFQPIKFFDVDDMLSSLPQLELEMTQKLRKLVFDTLPQITEKLSYNVPFYYGISRICFIWPGSVPWGGIKEGIVQFGFTKGYLLNNINNYLDKGNRKEVFMKSFNSISEIDTNALKFLLVEAWDLDCRLKKNRKL